MNIIFQIWSKIIKFIKITFCSIYPNHGKFCFEIFYDSCSSVLFVLYVELIIIFVNKSMLLLSNVLLSYIASEGAIMLSVKLESLFVANNPPDANGLLADGLFPS